jgi:hypothetical protein
MGDVGSRLHSDPIHLVIRALSTKVTTHTVYGALIKVRRGAKESFQNSQSGSVPVPARDSSQTYAQDGGLSRQSLHINIAGLWQFVK